MGKRVNLSSLADAPVEDVPGYSTATLVGLRPERIAPTPLNPRENYGSTEDLVELGESMRVRQLQPVVAVSRARYLTLWPDHEDDIGAADHVLVNGERRYRAAVHVGLERLDVIVREEIADSRAAFLDALFSENIDRKNFDPIEEALAVEAMVRECETASAAAVRFRRHETWVSQRRALLKLAPDMQQRVRTGEVPLRIARSVAALPQDEQEAAWLRSRAEQVQEAQQRGRQRQPRSPRGEASPAGAERSARQLPGPDPAGDARPGTGQRETFTAVKTDDGAEPPPGTGVQEEVKQGPESAGQRPDEPGPDLVDLEWHDLHSLAATLREHLDSEELTLLASLITSGS